MLHEYRVTNKASDTGEVVIYGDIGSYFWGEDFVSALQFKKDLAKLGNVKSIDLRLNSNGGVITEAQAMYTLLNEHPANVHVYIDGIAASAASFLAMVGDQITIADGGFVMIHNARGAVSGEAQDLEAAAQVLRSMNGVIRKKYADRTGQSLDKIRQWMDAETWFDSADALKYGFATDVLDNMKAVALFSGLNRMYANAPACVRSNRLKAMERLNKHV